MTGGSSARQCALSGRFMHHWSRSIHPHTVLSIACRLQSRIFLSLSLLALIVAIPREGKAIITAAAFKDLLLLTAILLKSSAAASESLLSRLNNSAGVSGLPQALSSKANLSRQASCTDTALSLWTLQSLQLPRSNQHKLGWALDQGSVLVHANLYTVGWIMSKVGSFSFKGYFEYSEQHMIALRIEKSIATACDAK